MGQRLWILALLLVLLGANTMAQAECGTGIIDIKILFGVDTDHAETVDGEIDLPLVLTCQASEALGGAIDVYEWRRNDEVVQAGVESTFTISMLSSSDGGEYTCNAFSSTRNCSATSSITVITTVPEITDLEPPSLIVTEGEPFTLTCAAEGWPVPTIQWSSIPDVIGGMVPPGPVYTDSSASTDEAATYTCTATNSRSSNVAAVTVDVLELTNPPTTAPATTQITEEASTDVASTEPSDAFIISIAVICAFGFFISVFTIIGAVIWLCMKWDSNQPEEEVVMEELETGKKRGPRDSQIDPEVVLPELQKKRNRARL